MQDIDPKHTSRVANEFFTSNNVNLLYTPPESLDMNPVEMKHHSTKPSVQRFIEHLHACIQCPYYVAVPKTHPIINEVSGMYASMNDR